MNTNSIDCSIESTVVDSLRRELGSEKQKNKSLGKYLDNKIRALRDVKARLKRAEAEITELKNAQTD